ncbi:ATPase involved in DNA repair [Salmonella enterica subsp. enterica serovar Typhi]|nr:ATPase involved in DNA repair [Salmonella enterica subsp. enterica serovar Typhi]CRC14599.1 ATPase involved in DNA repair [Salmonella enterica subsp. enterica serovar Typhi]
MISSKVLYSYERNDIKISCGLYNEKTSAKEKGIGRAGYYDAITGELIEAETLEDVIKIIALPEVVAEYNEHGDLIRSLPADIEQVVRNELLFSDEKIKQIKIGERDGKKIIEKYQKEEKKYNEYLERVEKYKEDPNKNPLPSTAVAPPKVPEPFIYTNSYRDRASNNPDAAIECYQIILNLEHVPVEEVEAVWKVATHAMAHDNYVFEYPQDGSNTTPRGLKGRRPVIFNNIHVKQDAPIHGQAYVFTRDISEAKYVPLTDEKRAYLEKEGKLDLITYFPNDKRAFVPEQNGVYPWAKWSNAKTKLQDEKFMEVFQKHIERELKNAGYNYPFTMVSVCKRFKDADKAEAVRKVHTDLPKAIDTYKESFVDLAKIELDPEHKHHAILNKYNTNIKAKQNQAADLLAQLEKIERDVKVMEAAKTAEIENLSLTVEVKGLTAKVSELTEQTSLKDEEINQLKEDLEKEIKEKEEFVDKNNELYFKNTELEKEKEELAKEVKTLEDENIALEKENTTLTEKVSALEEKNTNLENELKTLDFNTTKEIDDLKGQVESLNGQLEQKDITHAADKEAALAELRKELSEAFETEKQEALAKLREELTAQFKVDNEKALEAQKITLEAGFTSEKTKALNELREELNKSFGVKENEYKEVIKGLRTESAENFELANTYSQKMRTFLQENTDLVEENRKLKKQIEDFNNGNENRPKNK